LHNPACPIADQVAFAAKKSDFQPVSCARGRVPVGPRAGPRHEDSREHRQRWSPNWRAEGLIEVLPGIGTVVAQPAAPRSGRARLLACDVEHLAVQAMQIGVSLEDCKPRSASAGAVWRGG